MVFVHPADLDARDESSIAQRDMLERDASLCQRPVAKLMYTFSRACVMDQLV